MNTEKRYNRLAIVVLGTFVGLACNSASPRPGGSTGTGGGGEPTDTGGAPGATGGAPGTGGSTATGGSTGTGGSTDTGGTGGSTDTGGSTGTGGATDTGGTGGSTATGGRGGGKDAGADGPKSGTGGKGGSGGNSGVDPTGMPISTLTCDSPGLVWHTANKTNYTSYPVPGSAECIQYNGCFWQGKFNTCGDNLVKTKAWVMSHNIIALFPLKNYGLHAICLKAGGKTLEVTAYDTCGDSDCSGCCTQNKGSADALVDIESFTNKRFGVGDGKIMWADLGYKGATCTDAP
jgi:hypothetical protein